jgi:hypothetical protein
VCYEYIAACVIEPSRWRGSINGDVDLCMCLAISCSLAADCCSPWRFDGMMDQVRSFIDIIKLDVGMHCQHLRELLSSIITHLWRGNIGGMTGRICTIF